MFTVLTPIHPTFGPTIVLDMEEDGIIRFTPTEARTVAHALMAMRDGRSLETEIFLSPIVSDASFSATKGEAGLTVTIGGPDVFLSWSKVSVIAQALDEAVSNLEDPIDVEEPEEANPLNLH